MLEAESSKIEIYGDSTSKGFRPSIGGYFNPTLPERIAAALAALGLPVPVQDEGRSATRIEQLVAGTDATLDPQPAHLPVVQQAAASNATVVTVNHAINNQAQGQSPAQIAQYRTDLAAFAAAWRNAGKQVVFITPNPTNAGASLGLYVAAMKDVGAVLGVPVIDVHAYLTGVLAGAPVTTLVPDGIHPNEATYALMADYIAAQLKALAVPLHLSAARSARPRAGGAPGAG